MLSTCASSTRQFARPYSIMANWVFVAALFAAAAAAPQSYIVGPGHFHYEFGGQNEFKYTTPAPVVKSVPVSTVAPIVSPVVKKVDYQVNPIPYRAPVTVRPVTQQVGISQYPAKPYVSQYPSSQYSYPSSQYSYPSSQNSYPSSQNSYPSSQNSYPSSQNSYPYSQYTNPSQYSYPYKSNYQSQYSYPYGGQRTVSQSVGVNVPQYNKVTVPQYNKVTVPVPTLRSQPVTPVVSVQQPQPVSQVYSSQAQSGQNYGRYAILRYIVDITPQGNYNYAYETENGIQAEESGELRNAGSQDEAEVAQGYYSYTGPDGVVYTVRYIADENGFRAEGDHLPKIPEVIQRSLEYLKTLPPQPDEQKK